MPLFRLVIAVIAILSAVVYACPVHADPTAGTGNLAALSAQVGALPESTKAQALKKVVLQVGVEESKACAAVGELDQAARLRTEVQGALGRDAEEMARPNPNAAHITALIAVAVKSENPYLTTMVKEAQEDLSKPDARFPRSTLTKCVFNDFFEARRVAGTMHSEWWLFANSDSPLKQDPKLLARILHRGLAAADAILINQTGKRGSPFDLFAGSETSVVMREFAQVYPGLLLPSQQADWTGSLRQLATLLMQQEIDRPGTYANMDLAFANEFLSLGLYFNDQRLLDKAKFLIDAQEAHLLDDGGFYYINHQNESANYHHTDVRELATYYAATGYPMAADLIRRSQWYAPVTGRLIEFWTTPSWKHTWNQTHGTAVGGEIVFYLTGNPYVRGMLDQNMAEGMSHPDVLDAVYYRKDVAPKPLPDNTLLPDRNIVGPRAWYGRFNYAATLRPIPVDEPGHSTLMGAQVLDDTDSLDTALMGVYTRVRVGTDVFDPAKGFNDGMWAFPTSDLKGGYIVGKTFCSAAATYELAAYRSSRKGGVADWRASQVWIGLPDRIIGLLRVTPTKDGARAFEVNGVVRLGFGGTALATVPKKIETLDGEHGVYKFGNLVVSILQSNYAAVTPVVVPFRVPKAPATEITLRDPLGMANTANKQLAYPASAMFQYVVEIKPAWAKGDTHVQSTDSGSLIGLRADCAGKSYQVWFNPTGAQAALPLASLPANSDLRLSDAPRTVLRQAAGASLSAWEHAVEVTSPDAVDHEPGWESFAAMVSAGSEPARTVRN